MSGLVSGLQNRARRFESARNLSKSLQLILKNQLGGKDFFYPYLPFSDSTQEAVNVTTN